MSEHSRHSAVKNHQNQAVNTFCTAGATEHFPPDHIKPDCAPRPPQAPRAPAEAHRGRTGASEPTGNASTTVSASGMRAEPRQPPLIHRTHLTCDPHPAAKPASNVHQTPRKQLRKSRLCDSNGVEIKRRRVFYRASSVTDHQPLTVRYQPP